MANEAPSPSEPVRGVDVLWFNYPTYLAGIAVVIGAIATLALVPVHGVVRAAVAMGAGLSAWWLVASAAAAAWVYDRSALRSYRWLPPLIERPIDSWLNVTTGFDDSSGRLRRTFPGSTGTSVDVFDPAAGHEGHLERARRSRPPGGLAIRPGEPLPAPGRSVDAVFMIMSVHELREDGLRLGLFSEAARVLRPGGRLVLVEHLRDAANAIAFGPGFLHFLARDTWLADASAGGFRLDGERSITPFVRVLAFSPRPPGSISR